VLEIPGGDEYKMTIRELEAPQHNSDKALENLLADMKEKKEYRIIIDCHVTRIPKFLEKVEFAALIKITHLSSNQHSN
jgi:isochorismate synthase EntC